MQTVEKKTKEELATEVAHLRQRIAEFEQSEIERKQAEEILKEREVDFRALVENAAEGIVVVSRKGNFLYANSQAAAITGYSVEELLQVNMRDLFSPDEHKKINTRFKKRIAGEAVSSQYTTEIIRKDENKIPLDTSIALTTWNGELIRIVSLRDITDRKRAEEKLQKNENYLKKAQQIAHFGSWVWDVGANRVEFSDEMFNIIGITKKQFDGTPEYTNNLVMAEDRARVQECYKDLLIRCKSVSIEYSIVRPDGSIRHLWGSGEIESYKAGRPERIIGTVLDITEHKRAEEEIRKAAEEYRIITKTSMDGFVKHDLDLSILDVNEVYCHMLGYSREELLKMTVADIEAIMTPDEIKKELNKIIDVGSNRFETQHRRKDGSLIHVEVSMTLLRHSGQILVFLRDITERKHAEEKLRQSEERYRFFFEHSQTINILLGTDGKIIDVNENAVEALGYKKREVVGKNVLDFVVPEQRVNVSNQLAQELKGEYTPALEIGVISKKGIRTLLFTGGHATLFENGELTGILLSVVDITERKRTEEALRESEERFRTIFETARDFIFLKDRDFKLTAVNPAMEQLYGIPASKLIGKTSADIFGKAMAARLGEQDVRVLNGEIIAEEHPSPLKGSTNIHHVIKVPIRNSAGEIVGICGIGRDITERKQMEEELRQSEERFRKVVETMKVGMGAIDENGMRTYANEYFCKMLGYSMDELIGHPTIDFLYDEESRKSYEERLAKRRAGMPDFTPYEVTWRRKDGQKVYAILSPTPSFDAKGRFTGSFAIYTDITERKRAEDALEESEKRYRNIFETIPVSIIVLDKDGQMVDINPYHLNQIAKGQTPKGDFVGTNIVTHPTIVQAGLSEKYKKLLVGESFDLKEIYFPLLTTGTDGYFNVRGVPLLKGDEVIGAVIIHEDITERKKAQEELRDSEERYRFLFENSQTINILIGTDGKILDINENAAESLGFKKKNIIGKEVLEFVVPDQREEVAQQLVLELKGEYTPPLEIDIITKKGARTLLFTQGHGTLFEKGELIGMLLSAVDITERKKSEKELKIKDNAIASSNNAIAIGEFGGSLTYVNPMFLKMWGYGDEKEVLGKPAVDFWHEKEEAQEVIEALLKEEDVVGELKAKRKDGSLFDVQLSASIVRDEADNPVSMMASFVDISKRKQMEVALEESEEKYRSLVESSEDSIYLVDQKCNYIFLNNRHLSRLGVKMKQAIGRPYAEFHSPEESQDFAHRVKTVVKTGQSLSYEYRSQQDNRYFIRTLSPVTFPDGGEITAITVVSTDITERKQAEEALQVSEERLTILFEFAPDAYYVSDLKGTFLDGNRAAEEITGYKREQLIGKSFLKLKLLSKTQIPKAAAILAQNALGKPTGPDEITLNRKDGSQVPLEIRAYPIKIQDQTLVLGIARDITERKQAEEALREREAFNYALFKYNPVETIVVDLEGKVTAFNLAKQQSGDRLPSIGDIMYKDYAGMHEIDMHAELMGCITSGKSKGFSERKYGDKFLNITISPFAQGAIIISEDITERKRTEEALRESEKFSSSLLNDAPHPILVVNPDTSIRYVNPAFEKLTGFPSVELIGRKVPYPWWTKGTERRTTGDLREALRKDLQRIEISFQKRSGERFWVEISSIPTIRNGEVQYLLGNWIDITERKRAEELLQKERDAFYSILEKVPSGVMVEDAHGNFSFINSEFTSMTGYTLEDVPNRREWRHRAYPDQSYRNMVQKAWENDYVRSKDQEIFHKRFKRPFTRVFTVMCKDGASKEIEFRVTEVGDGGTIFMLSDITERQRMHELLETSASEWRTTFDAINDAVCLLDPHAKIIRCNNAMLQIMGKPFSQIINHHCWELIHGVSEAPHSCSITLVGKTHKRETEVMFKDARWFNISVDPLLDEDGTIFGSVHIMSDITDRMHIQNELQDSREQLRNLTVYLQSVREQERTNIAREIHDELAQALTALKMDVSWLDNRLPSDAQSLSEKTKSMGKLIDSTIHTVKRISAELRPGVLDDLGLVAAIEWQAEEFQNRTGISCDVKVDPQDLMVDQDRSTAIFRIFQETLTNVARHARATRVSVSLKERGERLTLRVKDNGTGITEEQIAAPQSFGLIGIRERVHPWGGKVSIKGIPGKGTTVMVNMELAHSKHDKEKSELKGIPS